MDADLAETVDMLTRAVGIIERELAKSAALRRPKGEVKVVYERSLLSVNAASFVGFQMCSG